MVSGILSTLVLGLLIGFTGALAPGPTLVATINASLNGNWAAGLKVSLGHIVIETAIFFLIILGLAGIASPYTAHIALVGGVALIVFGIMTIAGSAGLLPLRPVQPRQQPTRIWQASSPVPPTPISGSGGSPWEAPSLFRRLKEVLSLQQSSCSVTGVPIPCGIPLYQRVLPEEKPSSLTSCTTVSWQAAGSF